MEGYEMKKRLILFIGLLMIPFFILLFDHYFFNKDTQFSATYDQSEAWQYIVSHQEEYPSSLLRLATSNKEAIPFVYHYKDRKCYSMSLKKDLKNGLPHLLQWDERWGYKIYDNDMMAINGCGPTCLSMVVSYLKHNEHYHPYYMAQYAFRHGYHDENGTSWSLMSEGARNLGLKVQELSLNKQDMIYSLISNHPIICSMRKGAFTSTGHYIVIKDYQDGLFYINDPNSIEKSRGYQYEEFYDQIKNLWSYSI